MNPVTIIEGRGAPLDRSDVDTDQIIPSDWLKRVERTGFGRGLFAQWRDDPSFVLNQPVHQGAVVLIAGARFGTGSSREHAVWALQDYGFAAVVASSFGDIFKNNALTQGLLTVELSPDDLQDLLQRVQQSPELLLTIDVGRGTIEIAEQNWQRHFELAVHTRERLLRGWDPVSATLSQSVTIATFEHDHDALTPSLRGLFDVDGRVVHSDP